MPRFAIWRDLKQHGIGMPNHAKMSSLHAVGPTHKESLPVMS